MSVIHHILVDANGAPVPLPFHTSYESLPVTVIGGKPPRPGLAGTVEIRVERLQYTCPASWLGLEWITEAKYMEKQS